MPAFDECCVLIPAATLEDFPTDLSDADARSLLAAWTVLWHPALLAHCRQMPLWYRADAPPEPAGRRVFALPQSSAEKLPEGYRRRSQGDSLWLTGPSREAMLEQFLEQLSVATGARGSARHSSRASSTPAETTPTDEQVTDAERSSASERSPEREHALQGNSNDEGASDADANAAAEPFPSLWRQRIADKHWPELRGERRTITVEDFYAAAFAALQIQVMTRRLRYTSNLDEIHLQSRLLAAADAFVAEQAQTAIDALHDVFDALAEERDHYFSSDPHLIDLTLLTPSTLESCLDQLDDFSAEDAANRETSAAEATGSTGQDDSEPDDSEPHESKEASFGQNEGPLPTPRNVLIDQSVAEAIAKRNDDPRVETLRELLRSGRLGWAGGGPTEPTNLDARTMAEAEAVFVEAWRQTCEGLGLTPSVYGRFAGSTPADLTRTLVALGYRGMIPLDFAGGSGHGDEAKVILQSAGAELEALTVKPIDASGDAAFLNLGARLGEAIDSGEIATALLAHWPGQSCDTLEDLRRVASWSLALGRFWKLEDYFVSGEHPYHHGVADATASDGWRQLQQQVQTKTPDPISSVASRFVERVKEEQQAILAGMAALVSGDPALQSEPASESDGKPSAAEALAQAVTRQPQTAKSQPKVKPQSNSKSANDSPLQAVFLGNSHSVGCRQTTTIDSPALKNAPQRSSASKSAQQKSASHVYAVTAEGRRSVATLDIPGCGFVIAQGSEHAKSPGALGGLLRSKLLGGPKPIAESGRLQNEFMEVTLSEQSGGISGVYSGGTRGNRFSLRLIRHQAAASRHGETEMRLERQKVITATPALGCLETRGEIVEANDGATLAHFVLRYTLHRGSRFLHIDGDLSPVDPIQGDPWYEYYAARVAVVTEAALYRALVREKVHRCRSRRVVAPLGLVIDEAERQTLVAGHGLPYHRRVGDRFLDTLLRVQGETRSSFSLAYGFDVPAPVASSRALVAPPQEVPLTPADGLADVGWMVHVAPKDLLLSTLMVGRRDDGDLAAIVRVIQTRPRNCKATVRFFRNVKYATAIEGTDQAALQLPRPQEETANASEVSCKGDTVSLALPSHGISDLLVVFEG